MPAKPHFIKVKERIDRFKQAEHSVQDWLELLYDKCDYFIMTKCDHLIDEGVSSFSEAMR